MLWRLAVFYLLVAPLEIGVLGLFGPPPETLPGTDVQAAVGAFLALVLGPLFNLGVSYLCVRRLGRISGFAVALVNVVGFELMNVVLVGARNSPTRLALPFDLMKLAVPWGLSLIPWIRRSVLSRPQPKARAALFGASATDFSDGEDVAQILARTEPFERGVRAVLSRRPPSWDASPTRLEQPPRGVPSSLMLSLLTSGSSALGWVALSLGLGCVALLGGLDRMRGLPVEMAGVPAIARLIDCRESPPPSPLGRLWGDGGRHTLRYRYEVDGVEHHGVSSDDLACPQTENRWADPEALLNDGGFRILYWPSHPERSWPVYRGYHEPFSWTILFLLGALVGIHAGIKKLSEAVRGISVLRRGRAVHGETIAGFPVALTAGPKRFVPVLASTSSGGRLLVEVLEPRSRGSTGPVLLVPDRGPIVPWDHLPVLPAVNAARDLLGPRKWGPLVARAMLTALTAAVAAAALASWRHLLGRG